MIYLDKHNIINPNRFGFRSNSRTTDSIFVLQQLIHKAFDTKEKLHVAFIEFQNAFDSVWHKGLLTKLQTIGVSGNFLKILHSMYGTIKSCVKISPNTVTAPFPCNKGIRQGDGPSPVLFSLYMNDIPNLLTDKKCLGIKLEDQNINCLMYADDLIPIRTSANDLQHSFDVLEEHVNNWKLKINVKKSIIMIFNPLNWQRGGGGSLSSPSVFLV